MNGLWQISSAVALTLLTACAAQPNPSNGHTGVFMGHSFFTPIAVGFEQHAHRAGLSGHRQTTFTAMGKHGTPGWFWESQSDRERIRSALSGGDVDLVGFTFHPDGLVSHEDYKRWIDEALKQNRTTRFFIAVPWPVEPKRGIDRFFGEFDIAHGIVHSLMAGLRRDYPGTDIFCVPYGRVAVELKRRFEAGELPGIDTLVGDKTQTALFRDDKGHPGELLEHAGRLVWLAVIYGVDLHSYDWDGGFEADLRAIAASSLDAPNSG